ncbi:MAG: hypothetical protein AAGI38_20795 [Bacteroidota bacterium]
MKIAIDSYCIFGPPLKLLALLLTACCLCSCEFDPDEEFIPVTQSSLLLVKEETGRAELWQQEGEVLNPNLGSALGLEILDLAGEANFCWLAAGQAGLVKFNMETNQVATSFVFDTLGVHRLTVGSIYILVGDTLRNSLLFVNKEDGELEYQIALEASPRKLLWRNQRFYVQVGSNEIHTFREETLSPLEKYTFDYPIVDLQADNGLSVWVQTQDSVLRATAISVVTDQVRRPIEEAVTYQKVRYTPFARDLYGSAILEDFFLEDGQLSGTALTEVQDFEVDFFSGTLWISQRDTVKIRNIRSGNLAALRQGSPIFIKAYHYVAPKGE